MPQFDDDFIPVTGGTPIAPDKLRHDVTSLKDLNLKSDLDRHIARLLALHPRLQVRFRHQDLLQLDDATKTALLQDMNDLLGISLKSHTPAK